MFIYILNVEFIRAKIENVTLIVFLHVFRIAECFKHTFLAPEQPLKIWGLILILSLLILSH